ncbi:MAG TPA: hypothetical protein VLR89_06270 [Anaerolineaceae bacterium]|nr:hypothetical protein [Anaerolineaceae bacterium]
MKKLFVALVLTLLIVTACIPVQAPAENYPATVIAMEVKIKLMEEAIKATGQAVATSQMIPTQALPTLAPCPTCAPSTLVVTATAAPQPTATPSPTTTGAPTGGISGALNYPSSHIPAQRVVAFNIKTGFWYWQNTSDGTSSYSFEKLPVGIYHVVSYLISNPGALAGGYSQAVPCGLSVACTDHSLIDVEVKAGQVTTGVDTFDWYADLASSGWPADPTQN